MSKAALWTEEEMKAFMGVWGAEDVQSQLDWWRRTRQKNTKSTNAEARSIVSLVRSVKLSHDKHARLIINY